MALIGEMKFLTIGDNTYSIPAISAATSSNLGGIKIGYSTSNKNYAVQLDNNNKAFVNVPWTDTTYSSLAAASGGTAVSLVTTGEKYIWNNMLPLTGGNVSGSVSIDDLTVGNLIVTGNTSFVQGIPFSTITGAPTTVSGYGITDAVTKPELKNAGITEITYTTVLDTTTVTTTTGTVHPKPYALLASFSSGADIYEGRTYKITVDGVEYTLLTHGWFVRWAVENGNVSSYTFPIIGNITYYQLNPNFYTDIDNVPFLITTLVQPTVTSQEQSGLYIFTDTEKSVSVKIELVTYQGELLPNYLIRGETAPAIDKLYPSDHTVRRSYSIGYNNIGKSSAYAIGTSNSIVELTSAFGSANIISARNSITIGNCNEISNTWSIALGQINKVSSQMATAVGYKNTISGDGATTVGYKNTASGTAAVAAGYNNTASGERTFTANGNNTAVGNYSTAFGRYSIANGDYSSVNGLSTISTHKSQFVIGECNLADTNAAGSDERGTYAMILGNGTADDARSNALTVDWSGNLKIAGSVTLGMGTADVTTLTAAQLKTLISTGTTGQVLTKTASGFAWQTLPIYNGGVS